MRWFLMLCWMCASLVASEQSEKDYQRAVEQAKAEFDAKVSAAKAVFVKTLKTEMDAATKKGDLDGALAIRGKINSMTVPLDEIKTLSEDQKKGKDEFDPDTVTAAQWDALQGLEFKVFASKKMDTKIVLAKGDKLIVVPHPDDKWDGGAGIYTSKGKTTEMCDGLPAYCVCCIVGGEKMRCGKLNGEGQIALVMNDNNLSDNSGFIRVKIIRGH